MENTPIDQLATSGIDLNPQNRDHLSTAAGWARFLAIIGFIVVGLMIVAALSVGSLLGTLNSLADEPIPIPPIFISIVYLLFAGLYFLPVWYLFNFASKMKTALQANTQIDFDSSIANLKAFFKFIGILTAIVLGFYALSIIGVLLFAGSMAAFGS